ncbi:MAG: hypothetical protein AABX47_08775 [Nanoarchaeota archaeon]
MGLDRYLNVIPWNPAHNKLEVDNLNGPYQQLKPMDRQNMRTILGVLKHYRISYNLAFSAASGRGNDTISFIVDSSAKTDSVIRSIPGVTNRVMSRERQYFPPNADHLQQSQYFSATLRSDLFFEYNTTRFHLAYRPNASGKTQDSAQTNDSLNSFLRSITAAYPV